MSGDSLRAAMVTDFICSECNEHLTVGRPTDREQAHTRSHYSKEVPDGAYAHHVTVKVYPCRSCIGKLQNAARSVADGLAVLNAQR